LDLNWCPLITNEGAARLVHKLRPCLARLSLRHCRRISDHLPTLLLPLFSREEGVTSDGLRVDLRDTSATAVGCAKLRAKKPGCLQLVV
jgi:hypothetical protein